MHANNSGASADEIKAATDLVELVGERVSLKRVGSRWRGLCPFHNERTPSFYVDGGGRFFKCFGCEAGGDAISFIRLIDGLDFRGALEVLGRRAGLAPGRRRDRYTCYVRRRPPEAPRPPRSWDGVVDRNCRAAVARLAGFADYLGVTVAALQALRTGWDDDRGLWTWPMRDASGRVIGVRTRDDRGEGPRKYRAYDGTINGLFVPPRPWATGPLQSLLLVCEGPTTCAALLGWGFDAIGRASADSCYDLVAGHAGRGPRRDVVMVADMEASGVGIRSAERHAVRLALAAASVRVITPPPGVKDAREWRQRGGTRRDVLAAIAACPPRRVSVVITTGPAAQEAIR